MASIFKQITVRSLPTNADIVTKNGKQFVRLKRDGRAVLGALTDCGTKYRDESRKWYIKFKDREGKWQRVPGYADKGATAQLASELERKQQQIQSGLSDPHESGKLRPLSEHVADFEQFLRDKANSAKHVKQTSKRVRRICDGCEFMSWKDISPSAVVNWLALQRERGNMGIKTSNYYQAALKEFCTWLIKDGRVPSNPVAHLQSLNSDPDIRWQRRPLSGEQFAALIESAMNGPPIQCMGGATVQCSTSSRHGRAIGEKNLLHLHTDRSISEALHLQFVARLATANENATTSFRSTPLSPRE